MAKKLVFLAIVVAAVVLVTAWPRLNVVETGRTPEYADLQPREYRKSAQAVTKAAEAAVQSLGWTLQGSGKGPSGSALHAVARTRVLRFQDDVTISVRRAKGRTRVSVRSQSRVGKWDFGQNARNIRAFLEALDAQLGLQTGGDGKEAAGG